MWKSVLAGAAALAIAGTTFVYAQQRDDGPRRWRDRDANVNISQEDRSAFTDARIAALKAGLRLTPEQEKNWPAFETALRELATMRDERRAERRAERRERGARAERHDFGSVERLRRHAERMTTAGEKLKQLADAQEPLYDSLDEAQKNRFGLLSRVLNGHRSHFAQMRERHHGRHHRMHERHHRGDDDRHGPRMRDREEKRERGSDNGMTPGMSERL